MGKFGTTNTETFVARALSNAGVAVKCYRRNETPYESLIRGTYGFDATHVLFSKFDKQWFPNFKNNVNVHGIECVCWLWDLYYGLRSSLCRSFFSDRTFTTDGGHAKEFKRDGINHTVLRQGIYAPHAYVTRNLYRWDVAFVGGIGRGYHHTRNELVRHLSNKHGGRFLHVKNVRGKALTELLSQVKIVVGDSYPSPHYWSNRIYEMVGRGAFFLHPETIGMDIEFTDGEHYVSYPRGNLSRVDELIAQYLTHTEARHAIAQRGFDLVRTKYTYDTRVRDLLAALSR